MNRPSLSVNRLLPASRQLSLELIGFLSANQPGIPEVSKFGQHPVFNPFQERSEGDGEIVAFREADLLSLAHGTAYPVDPYFFEWDAKYPISPELKFPLPFSKELASYLPKGHAYRALHEFKDDPEDVIGWLLGDPGLSASEVATLSEALLSSDVPKRMKHWPEFLSVWQRKQVEHTFWAQSLGRAVSAKQDEFLESLHPRETGVLRSIGNGYSYEYVAERFGVDESLIVEIFARSMEMVRKSYQTTLDLFQREISTRGMLAVNELAGIIREVPSREGAFLMTNLLVGLCSARRLEHDDQVWVLSEATYGKISRS